MSDNRKENIGKKASGGATQPEEGFFSRLGSKISTSYAYLMGGVWNDPHNSLKTRIVKILNLTVNSFLDSSLQNKSMSLTYSTVLAIVPAFALLVAIGRGFGLQDYLQTQLYVAFPSQVKAISTALTFVDSYLKSASQGLFVGVGIVVLLWTVISLLSSIEDSFNSIWDIKSSRSIYQKFTDYIAICLLIPILMICSSGVSFFMSDVIQDNLDLPFLTPIVNLSLGLAPLVLCWIAFTLSYYLIPNTKVKFKYAAIAGALGAVAFEVLQLLFLNGQIYVSKYNAIYGSLAFLPLLLIWLQLSWLVLLTGCMVAYSLQNVFTFNLMGDASAISSRGWHNIATIIMAITVKRFSKGEKPLDVNTMAVDYFLPIRVVTRVVAKLKKAGLVYEVDLDDDRKGLTPAVETETLTMGKLMRTFDEVGKTDFIPDFDNVYKDMTDATAGMYENIYKDMDKILIKELPLPTPGQIKATMAKDSDY